MNSADDFRFVRTWWEVASIRLLCPILKKQGNIIDVQAQSRASTESGQAWATFAKGGDYAPFLADIPTVVDWENDGARLKAWVGQLYGGSHWSRQLRSTDSYFQPGLTWPLRGIRLSAQAVPSVAIFSVGGKMAMTEDRSELLPLLGLINSSPFDYFVRVFAGKVGGVQYEAGLIGRVPLPSTSDSRITIVVSQACRLVIEGLSQTEGSRHFGIPGYFQQGCSSIADMRRLWAAATHERAVRLHALQAELDTIAFELYGIAGTDRNDVNAFLKNTLDADGHPVAQDNGFESGSAPVSAMELPRQIASYALGCAFGRWDIECAAGTRPIPELPGPFDPLPAYSPGMLNPNDLKQGEPYPIEIPESGILVDDTDHPDDIVRRVQAALAVIFPNPDEIEAEACEILGVKSLREYFRNPKVFFDFHIKMYSKSRRKAPIYWLLQSANRSYGVWLYYHKLDADTLFKALRHVVIKVQLEGNLLAERRVHAEAAVSAKEKAALEKEVEEQEAKVDDIVDFHDKLRRAAELHLVPDLDDGVVLTMAPLHELVPWKEPTVYWKQLLAGKYGWSSIGKQLREKGLVKA